jgi:hypothetical protein
VFCLSPQTWLPYHEFLDDRVSEQFRGQFGGPGRRVLTVIDLYLEALALADRANIGEPKPVARTHDRLTLRVADLGLEHDVDDNLGHGRSVRPHELDLHLTEHACRRVLSLRDIQHGPTRPAPIGQVA